MGWESVLVLSSFSHWNKPWTAELSFVHFVNNILLLWDINFIIEFYLLYLIIINPTIFCFQSIALHWVLTYNGFNDLDIGQCGMFRWTVIGCFSLRQQAGCHYASSVLLYTVYINTVVSTHFIYLSVWHHLTWHVCYDVITSRDWPYCISPHQMVWLLITAFYYKDKPLFHTLYNLCIILGDHWSILKVDWSWYLMYKKYKV